ncbi:MAG: GtrA family protein [Oscillospiraceae bacterium]|nr:GtrA family protein [Oscillospiraceae bacterium]
MKKLFLKYREPIVYVFFGALTTVVNYIIYFTLRFLGVEYLVATVVAWNGSVLFAYAVNRIFVFKSRVKGEAAIKEFILFVAARVFSLGLEALIMFLFIDCAHFDSLTWSPSFVVAVIPIGELIAKTVSQVVIVISNYIFSKLIIFKKKK